MAGLIKKTEDAKTIAFLYEKALIPKMQSVLENFLEGLGERIKENKNVLEYIYFDNNIEDYYVEKYIKVPSIDFLLDKFEKDEKIYYFSFGIEVIKDGVIACLGFLNNYEKKNINNYDWITFEKMKEINEEFFSKWNKKIEELKMEDFEERIAKCFYLSNIQFNDISPSSSVFDLIDNVDREVDYLSKYITENIIEKLFNN